jgi:YVTN family beta-propeller protein
MPFNGEGNRMKTPMWKGASLLVAVGLAPWAMAQSAIPMLVNYSGVLTGANGAPWSGVAGVTFLLYKDQQGGAPLWMETQNVTPDRRGHYTVTLGATSSEGIPAHVFANGEARWLAVEGEGLAEPARVPLVAVPYALKAKDAETIGGLPPSAFALAAPASVPADAASVTKPRAAPAISPDAGCTGITSDGTATANQVAKFTAPCIMEPSAIFESGGKVGIGTTTPAATLDVKGTATLRGTLTMNAKGAATAAAGATSNPLDLLAASFDSGTSTSISQHFRWQAEAAGNDTGSPSGTLNLLYAPGSGTAAETGLLVNSKGLLTFGAGQTFPGVGTITGVTAGAGLTGGGTTGTVNVGLTNACASGQVLQWNGSAWTCSTLGAGTITGVTAGVGLSGGGTSGSVTLANTGVLAVAGGTGITSSGGNAPTVSLNTSYTDGRYLRLAGGTLSGTLNVRTNGLTAGANQLVLAGGSVGIGTGTPGAPLEVAGSLKISGTGSALTFPDGTTQATLATPAGVLGVNPLQVALLQWFPAYQPSAVFAVGSLPFGVAFDGADIWVTNYLSNTVTELAAATGAVLGTFPVGSNPEGIAFDGANIWVANSGNNNVTKLAASTGVVVGTYSVGSSPHGIAFDGANIWVANSGSSNVTKLLASNGVSQGVFSVGSGPFGIAFDGANIWVTNSGSSNVTKLLASNGVSQGVFSVGSGPYGIAFDGANIWVTNSGSNNVTKLLASNGAVLGTFIVGSSPYGIAFDGANIWVANNVTVTKLSASTGTVLGTFTGTYGGGVAFDGANIWVTGPGANLVSKL